MAVLMPAAMVAAAALALHVVPPELPYASGGAEVLLKVSLSPVGRVRDTEAIRDVPPFTEAVDAAVRQWEFGPAEPGEGPPQRQVLVAAVFRPPALYDLTPPGPLVPLEAVPATIPVPVRWERPLYPPRALGDGIVIVEARVKSDGGVEEVTVLLSSPAFDGPARDAARRWWFRPAVWEGKAIPSVAYLIFAFRQPSSP
jgi:TonB family protein